MSKEPSKIDFPAGDFISDRAVRAVFGRRRATSPIVPSHSDSAVGRHSSETTPTPAGTARRLRRWSVAELIARAVAPPPSTT